MQVDIQYRPSYSLAVVKLEPNESIQVEAGSMVSMTPGITPSRRRPREGSWGP
jgi:uncharacterized protein (AIM24 family)